MNGENGYGLDELMVVEASRYISDWDVVLVGTGCLWWPACSR